MIKQLVVGLDGSEHSFSAAGYAEYFAERFGCEIKAVFAVDPRKTELPIVYGHFDYSFARTYIPPNRELRNFYGKLKDDLVSFSAHCFETCRQRCAQKKIPFISISREGFPSQVLTEESRSGDILFIGQKGENARFDRTIVGSTTEDVVRSSPRPVLVCPQEFCNPRKLLFPYDGSETAERALQFNGNTMADVWEELVILLVEGETATEEKINKSLRYLRKHGLGYRIVKEKGSPVETVLRVAEREHSDIILIGAHGKHKIKDYLLGSTTAHLVRKSSLPVLIVY